MGSSGHASTSTAKPNIHGSKVMLYIWWDQLGVVYYELLKPTETITGDRTQLMRLSRALKDKRPQYNERHDKVILQHDNTRPHVVKVVKTYLETLKCSTPCCESDQDIFGNGKSYPTRRILQTLLPLTITCFDQ